MSTSPWMGPQQQDPTQQQPQSAPQSYGNSITPLPASNGSAGSLTSGNVQQPDPIQQLESQVGPARQGLGQALQQQPTPQPSSNVDLSGPISQEIQRQQQQIQDLQPSSNRGGPIKRLLFSFLSGAGDAMKHDAGLPTNQDLQQRYTQNLIGLSNAQAVDSLRAAQTQQMQLVTRQLPNGEIIQIPQGHVATFDAAMARQQAPPADLNNQIARMVYADVSANRDPNQNPQIQSLIQLQRSLAKPAPETSAVQTSDYMALLDKAQTAGPMPQGALTDSRIMQNWLSTNTALSQQEKAHAISYLGAKTTPGAAGAQAATKIQLEDQNKPVPVLDTKQGNSLTYLSPADINARNAVENGRYIQPGSAAQSGKTGYAYDPSTNQTVLTNAGEALQKNYQAFRPVSEANIRNDTHDSKVLNDIAVKSNNLISASAALDQDQGQRNIIAQAITFADKDEQFRLGLWGSQLPTSFLNALGNSGVMRNATPQTRDYVVNLLSLREAAMGMQKLLTGSARSSEQQIAALQQTLPGLEPDSKLARQKMAAFTQNLGYLRQGLPQLPGVSTVPLQGQDNSSSSRHFPSMDSIEGQSYQYDPQTDSISPVSGAIQWLKSGGFFQKK